VPGSLALRAAVGQGPKAQVAVVVAIVLAERPQARRRIVPQDRAALRGLSAAAVVARRVAVGTGPAAPADVIATVDVIPTSSIASMSAFVRRRSV